MFIRRKNLLLVVGVAFFTSVLLFQIVNYDGNEILSNFTTAYHQGTDSFRNILKNRITTNQLIFPNYFPLRSKQLRKFVSGSKTFNLKELDNPKTFKHDQLGSLLTSNILNAKYVDHPLKVYTDVETIDLDLDKCGDIQTAATIGVDQPKSMDVSLAEVMTKFIEEADKNPYYKEMAPFFIEELKLQLEYNVVDHYWYRLAGSSVWLEEYQSHFMISRIMYSPSGHRNQPVVSLTYGQLYDKHWKELANTKIVVPTNNLNNLHKSKDPEKDQDDDIVEEKSPKDEEKHYKIIKFPYFLPIPFWHDFDDIDGKYYGPEDPRLMLVKNEAGYEEPLIVFNAHHRKLTHFDDDNDDKILLKADFYRSMFMCWPWQFQKGKIKTDGFKDSNYDKKYYNKVVELKMKNLPRRNKQKNWTPFTSELARQRDGYDKYINFVYRWANFEVLKCDLVHDTGVCSFEYRLNPNLATKEAVGPFRGGTELININGLLGEHANKFIRNDREVWVGFARAHIDHCGCGNNMYRPNLVVVTRDSVIENSKKKNKHGQIEFTEREKGLYKISHVSSSISFNIPIIGWDLLKPSEVCVGPNVLIPNGLSSWVVKDFSTDKFEDYATLSLSVADYTVHTINIKGLLREVLSLSDGHVFTEVIESNSLVGFGNDNLICALKSSTEFCYNYGLEHDNQEEDLHDIHKIFDTEGFDLEELEDNFNIEQVEEFQHENSAISQYERAVYLQKMHAMYSNNAPSYEPPKNQPPQRQHSPPPKPTKSSSDSVPSDTNKGYAKDKSKGLTKTDDKGRYSKTGDSTKGVPKSDKSNGFAKAKANGYAKLNEKASGYTKADNKTEASNKASKAADTKDKTPWKPNQDKSPWKPNPNKDTKTTVKPNVGGKAGLDKTEPEEPIKGAKEPDVKSKAGGWKEYKEAKNAEKLSKLKDDKLEDSKGQGIKIPAKPEMKQDVKPVTKPSTKPDPKPDPKLDTKLKSESSKSDPSKSSQNTKLKANKNPDNGKRKLELS